MEEGAERARLAPWWHGRWAEVSGFGSQGGGVGEEGAAAHWRGRGVREEGVHPGGATEESERRVCGPATRWRRSQRGG